MDDEKSYRPFPSVCVSAALRAGPEVGTYGSRRPPFLSGTDRIEIQGA
jgi:hypothetical protein